MRAFRSIGIQPGYALSIANAFFDLGGAGAFPSAWIAECVTDPLDRRRGDREALLDVARGVYRSYGFVPIDTPALEYLEILTGKGSEETDKQMYRFTDHGGREVGMRFDLTVPLARFAAQHVHELGLPFKRYHMATVWRGENTQRGRYREFMQCDFDTIGTTSPVADLETVLVVHDLLAAIGIEAICLSTNAAPLDMNVLNASFLASISAGTRSGIAAIVFHLSRTASICPCRSFVNANFF